MSLSSASTHRAWQELPRKLRRRAASHDVRRVPARLRGKARAEVSERPLVISCMIQVVTSTATLDGPDAPQDIRKKASQAWEGATRKSCRYL